MTSCAYVRRWAYYIMTTACVFPRILYFVVNWWCFFLKLYSFLFDCFLTVAVGCFCVWQSVSVTSWTRSIWVAEVSSTSRTKLFCFSLVESEPAWLQPEKLKFEKIRSACVVLHEAYKWKYVRIFSPTFAFASFPQWGTADAEIKKPICWEPRAQRFSLLSLDQVRI